MLPLLRVLVDVKPGEAAALAWSWLYFFSILSAYYVLRPIRDEIGAAGGVENLPWLFTGTLIGMLVANPPFSALVVRLAPVRFIAWTYRFFMANLVLFLILLGTTTGPANVWAGRAFYVWAAIFNLFIVSVFWGFLADVFSSDQSRRLFGFIAAGGTLGGIAGSSLTSVLVEPLGSARLLAVSAVLLEVAVFSVRRLARISQGLRERRPGSRDQDAVVGGGVLSGLTHAIQSPYLLQLTLYMLLFTILSTFLYFQQADIARRSFTNRAARTAFFANVDMTVNVLTLLIQLLLTGRIIKRLGVAITLTLLPLLSVAGFAVVGVAPTVWAVVTFQVLRRAGNFAVARPTRETCFTVIPREDKYKAKSFIDTFVYRAGDQIGAWSYAGLGVIGLGLAGISLAAVPIAIVWLVNGLWLGRRNEALAREAARAASARQPG
ncbi:MAG: MFS transporter [Candidatus Rokubacteria bacterium]|nr:MFS transporter [Candidatus Rokubacteria bacterium]